MSRQKYSEEERIARRKETMRKSRKKWEAAHPDFRKLYQRTEKALAWKREWKKRNPDYPKRKWQKVKDRVFDMYGRTCVRCAFGDVRALQLDHVKNDGYKHRIRRRSGRRVSNTQPSWYDAMKSYQPDKYQILCANCNWIKRHEHEM